MRGWIALALMVFWIGVAHADGLWDLLGPALETLADPAKARERCQKEPSSCKPETAAHLLSRCDTTDDIDRARCAGMMQAMVMYGRDLPEWRCVPPDVFNQPEQLRLLYIREAHGMPEVLHAPAERLLFYAIAKAFPCKLLGPPAR